MFGNKLVIMVVGVVAAVFPFWCVLIHSGLDALESEVEILHDSGDPITLDDLREYYPAPDPADGPHPGEVYERAFRRLRDPETALPEGMSSYDVPASMPTRGTRWAEEVLDREGEYHEHHAETRQILHRAARMGPAHFQFDFKVGTFTPPPAHLSLARQGIRLLQSEVVWHAHHGRTDDAFEAMLAVWGLADMLRDEPLMMSYFTHAAMLQAAIFATEWLVRHADLSGDQLASLQETAEGTLDGGRALRRALIGERVIGHTYFQQTNRGERGDDSLTFGPSELLLLRVTGVFPRDHADFLRTMREGIAATERRDPTAIDRLGEERPFYALISGVLTAGNKIVMRLDLAREARTQTAIVGLAAARHKLEHGEYPNVLENLVPAYLDAVPDDPFDPGKPLRYRRTETGAIVYSLGPNRTDHGGRELDDDGRMRFESEVTDITFTLGTAQAELWPEQWPSD